MKKTLLILAAVIAIATMGTWLATGANRGWTKTEVPVKTLDPVTEIEGITYKKQFQPGVEFLGAGLGGAGALFAAAFFFRKPTNQ